MQPQSPNPNYDFILKNGQKPKGKIPSLGLPKPVAIGIVAVVLIMALIILVSVLGGSKNNSVSVVSLMARAQEISRVSSVTNQSSQDPALQALTTTVSTIMDSQEAQLQQFLSAATKKSDSKLLGADQNPATDTLLQTAVQNNNLSSTYASYLVGALNTYKSQLSDEFKKASNLQLKAVLNDDYTSVQTILDNGSLQSS